MPKNDATPVRARPREEQREEEQRRPHPVSAARGLDWLNLFVANIQTGFGPFVAVYLATQGWTQTAIGFALSFGTLTSMASQVPAGALVDALRRKSRVAGLSILVFTLSALLFAIKPLPLFVYAAEALHGFSSCTLGPAIAAMSLAMAGQAALGSRLGRNARYASIGNGIGAALIGACGYYISNRAVFFLTAALTLPALFALAPLSKLDGPPAPSRRNRRKPASQELRIGHLLAEPRLLIFALCVMLFTFGNAAMLPLASSILTKKVGDAASLLIAACIVLPQLIVALLSPTMGRLAELRGRRLVLIIGLSALPLRGLLFAIVPNPIWIVPVQLLDGVAATCLGILVTLVTSDIAGSSGHFNLVLGSVGFAMGIGATFSTPLAGMVADRFGDPAAFIGLAVVGALALLLGWGAMPETGSAGAAGGLTRPASVPP